MAEPADGPDGAPEGVRTSVRFVVEGHRRDVAQIAATAFLGGTAEALFLVTVTRAAFAITDGKDEVNIVSDLSLSVRSTLLVALALLLVRLLLSAYSGWRTARLSAAVVARVREQLSEAFLQASWEVQQRQHAGSLQELLTTYSNQSSFLMGSLTQGVVAGANLLALVGMAIAVDPVGALVLVASVGVLGLLLRPMRAAVRRRARHAAEAGMVFATAVGEISELGLELHVFHAQRAAGGRIRELIHEARDRAVRLQFAASLTSPLYTSLAYMALIGALALVTVSETASLTSLGAAMLVMLRSLSYGQALQSSHTNVSASAPLIEELQRQLAVLEAGRPARSGQPLPAASRLAAHSVTFSYPDGPPVLRDISFSIEPREVVGIVGPSGAGKSTLVELLLGLRDPDQGRITIDGRAIADVDAGDLARRITFVPQAAHLISGTIADNIRFLRDHVSSADVEQAARLAHVHDEIESFELGYDHMIGARGSGLSGGQRQRICIARALVDQPDILILDEPTSALDVRSEHLIRTTLDGLRATTTVIVIAHRLSTLDVCDRIMVIQAGELRGFDAPAQLERSNAFYREALELSGLR